MTSKKPASNPVQSIHQKALDAAMCESTSVADAARAFVVLYAIGDAADVKKLASLDDIEYRIVRIHEYADDLLNQVETEHQQSIKLLGQSHPNTHEAISNKDAVRRWDKKLRKFTASICQILIVDHVKKRTSALSSHKIRGQ